MNSYYIRTERLSVGYNGKPVIDEINLTLNRGEIMTLIGPNGAGKSTILKSLTRQLEPIAGTVWLDSKEMSGMNERDIAKKLSIVLTEQLRPELMSCEDIVATGRYPYTGRLGILSAHDREVVRDCLRLVHAEELKDCDFSKISDGQRQRVLLARALCQEPEIIILDEPTSFLDIRHKMELITLLKQMVREKNIAVLMSLHELDLAERVSDYVVCVNKGSIERCGRPEEIFTADYIERLYSLERGSFNASFGCLEMERSCGKPEAFVIGGGGSGIAVYRRLWREGTPFAAGVLNENDLDYPTAKALASKIITEKAFEPVSEPAYEKALEILKDCRKVYCPQKTFGTMNALNKKLRDEAERLGILARDD